MKFFFTFFSLSEKLEILCQGSFKEG